MAAGGPGNLTGTGLNPTQITGLASTKTLHFGGRVHRDKHHVGSCNRSIHVGREVKVATPRTGYDSIQPGLIDRQATQVGIVPGSDALFIQINHRDLQLRAAISNHRHGRPADITRAHATDPLNAHARTPSASMDC